MHAEIDDDADIRHARRKRSDPRDGDRENVLVLDRPLDELDRRVEALDVPDHERHAGAAGGRDDGPAFRHRRGNRLLDQKMHAAGDAFKSNVVVQVGRRRDGHRIDAAAKQGIDIVEPGAAERAGDEIPPLAVRIGNAHQFDAGHVREHPRMV